MTNVPTFREAYNHLMDSTYGCCNFTPHVDACDHCPASMNRDWCAIRTLLVMSEGSHSAADCLNENDLHELVEKNCPKCGSSMTSDVEVVTDERSYGDVMDGDSELGQSASRVWTCPACQHTEEDYLGFSGSGILR